jgi:hypothetical protein
MVPLFGAASLAGIRKLSYDQQILPLRGNGLQRLAARFGWTGYLLWVDAPFIGAGNFHFEFEAPPGLEAFDAGIFEVAARRRRAIPSPALARASGLTSRVHLYAAEAQHRHEALSWVRLRVRRQDFVGGAALAALLVAAVLWIAYVLRNEVVNAPGGIPALLLLFPTAIGAYIVRPGAHRLTVRMLLWARLLLAAISTLPFADAAALAVTPRKAGMLTTTTFQTVWLITAILGSACLVGLFAAWALPAPEISLRRWERRVGLDVRRTLREMYPMHGEPWIARRRRLRDEARAATEAKA